jgi:hypothetical protein
VAASEERELASLVECAAQEVKVCALSEQLAEVRGLVAMAEAQEGESRLQRKHLEAFLASEQAKVQALSTHLQEVSVTFV